MQPVGYYPQAHEPVQMPMKYAPHQQQQSTVVDVDPPPPAYQSLHSFQSFRIITALSCFVLWCCNLVFGLIAYLLIVVADRKKHADPNRARRLGNASFSVSIAGIVITISIVSFVVTFVRVFSFIGTLRESLDGYNPAYDWHTSFTSNQCNGTLENCCHPPVDVLYANGKCYHGFSEPTQQTAEGNYSANITMWVDRVLSYSSHRSLSGSMANHVIGVADVYPRYGPSNGSWTPDNGLAYEYIIVEFPHKSVIQSIDLYEVNSPGVVTAIEIYSDMKWVALWLNVNGTTPVLNTSRIFRPPLMKTSHWTYTVKITVDTRHLNKQWYELDAVAVLGSVIVTKSSSTREPSDVSDCQGGQIWSECSSCCVATCDNTTPVCITLCCPRCQCPKHIPVFHGGQCITHDMCPGFNSSSSPDRMRKSTRVQKPERMSNKHLTTQPTDSSTSHGAMNITETRPSFVVIPPRDITVREGERVVLSCQATGNPLPVVYWQKSTSLVLMFHATHYDGRITVTEENSLIIDPVNMDDSNGVYTCVALNVVGRQDVSTTLTVLTVC